MIEYCRKILIPIIAAVINNTTARITRVNANEGINSVEGLLIIKITNKIGPRININGNKYLKSDLVANMIVELFGENPTKA